MATVCAAGSSGAAWADRFTYSQNQAVAEASVGARMAWGAGAVRWGPEALGMAYFKQDWSSGAWSPRSKLFETAAVGLSLWTSLGNAAERWSAVEAFVAAATQTQGDSPIGFAPTVRLSGGVLWTPEGAGALTGLTADLPVLTFGALHVPVVAGGAYLVWRPDGEERGLKPMWTSGASASLTVQRSSIGYQ